MEEYKEWDKRERDKESWGRRRRHCLRRIR